MFAVDTPLYTGPLVERLGGLDFSFLLSAAVTAAVFHLVTRRAGTEDATPAPAAQETPVAV